MSQESKRLSMDRRRFVGLSATAAASGAILLAGLDTGVAFGATEEGVFTIVHTNDIHGKARVYPYVKGLMDQLDNAGASSVLVSAGDAFAGSAFANESVGLAVVDAMEMVGYDMMTIGNHEYMMAAENFSAAVTEADGFDILACNVVPEIGVANPTIKPFKIVDFMGKKIAFIGIGYTQPGSPDMITSITAAKSSAEALGTVDVFIGISHIGLTDSNLSNRSTYIAQQCPWFSVIVDGHSHTSLPSGQIENGVLIVQTGAYGNNIGVCELTFYDDGSVTPVARLIPVLENEANCPITPDSAVDAYVESIYALYGYLDAVAFTLPVKLHGERADVRTRETNLGNVVTDAMRAKTGADIALASGASLRNSLEAGDVTVGMLRDTLLAETEIAVVKLTGERILWIIENGISMYPVEHFLFPSFSGLSLAFDASKTAGSRIVYAALSDATLIDPAKTYTCAVREDLVANLYLDGIVANPVAGTDYEIGYGLQTESVTEYVLSGVTIPKDGEGRLRVAGTSYLLNFDGNGATAGSITPQTYSYTDHVTLPGTVFTRPGYRLTNWVDRLGTTYELGQAVTNVDYGYFGETTLFAHWEALLSTLTLDKASYQPGETVTFTATEFESGVEVVLTLHSTPIEVSRVTAAANGTFSGSFVFPPNIEIGNHSLIADNGIQSTRVDFPVVSVAGGQDAGTGTNSGKTPIAKTSDVTPLHVVAGAAAVASIGTIAAAAHLKNDEK